MKLQCYHNTYRTQATDMDYRGDIVLLHGWGMHSIAWDTLIPELLKHYQVTIIDLPGMGQSPLPKGDYSLEFITEKILEVTPQKATYLGWSLGGQVAQNIAIHFSERIEKLITVSSTPKFCQSEDWKYGLNPAIVESFRMMYEEDHEGTLIRFLALQCKDSQTYKEDVETLKQILYFCGLPAKKAMREGLNILQTADLRENLGSITVPTLHIHGRNDNLIPIAITEAWNALMPKAAIAVLEGQAHAPFLSDADLVAKAISDWESDL